MTTLRFTTRDLEGLPDIDGVRYEIIDGELYVSRQPDWHHQYACGELDAALRNWSKGSGAGIVLPAPGLIFADDENVAPDIVWISRERQPFLLDSRPHLHAAPDLVIEVLSPGEANARRDRDLKLKLYSRRGVREYWIVDWQLRTVEIYRRKRPALRLVATLAAGDRLTSPLLPGFALPISSLWAQDG